LAEREDISRGIVSGQSCRVIASSARLATALCSLKIAKETEMTLKADQRAEIVAKVKQFTTDLRLSDEQKEKLKTALTERLEQYRKENPTISREEVTNRIAISRTAIRERVVSFLTPEQLSRWDAMAKLKNFLGQKAA
jgi:predicted HTH transcriptional regulator